MKGRGRYLGKDGAHIRGLSLGLANDLLGALPSLLLLRTHHRRHRPERLLRETIATITAPHHVSQHTKHIHTIASHHPPNFHPTT